MNSTELVRLCMLESVEDLNLGLLVAECILALKPEEETDETLAEFGAIASATIDTAKEPPVIRRVIRKLFKNLRVKKKWKPKNIVLGMHKDGTWHGPKPPGPNWYEVAPGPLGGKIWKHGPKKEKIAEETAAPQELPVVFEEPVVEAPPPPEEVVEAPEQAVESTNPDWINVGEPPTEEEAKNIFDFIEYMHYPVNEYHRGKLGDIVEDKNIYEVTANMDSVIGRTTIGEGVLAWRGIEDDEIRKQLIDAYNSGTTFVDKGFLSTSLEREIAEKYSKGNTIIRITVPAGTNSLYQDYTDEAELILGRNSELHISKYDIIGEQYYFEAEIASKPQEKVTPEWINNAVLTEDEQSSMDAYNAGEYYKINSFFRFENYADVNEWTVPITKDMDAAIGRSTINQNAIVWRGIEGKTVKKKLRKAYETGKLFIDAGFLSTSLNQKIGESFGVGGAVIKINIPSGTNAYYQNKTKEEELTLGRNSAIQIIDFKDVNGQYYFEANLVGQEEEKDIDTTFVNYGLGKLSTEEKHALMHYLGGSYDTNVALRKGEELGKDEAIVKKHLDTMMTRSTTAEDTIAWRVIAEESVAKELINAYKSGTIYIDKAFMSTSLEEGIVNDFDEIPIKIRIKVPKGTHSLYTNAIGQYELILARETGLRFTKYKKKGGVHYFEAEVVQKQQKEAIDPSWVNYGLGKLSAEENDTKNVYIFDSRDINKPLREQKELSENEKLWKKHLDTIIARSTTTEDTIAWREISEESVVEELINAYKTGTLYVDKGFMSTSLDENIPRELIGGPIKIRIKVPKGTHSFYINEFDQLELILGRETPLRITNHKIKENGLQYFEAEVVQKENPIQKFLSYSDFYDEFAGSLPLTKLQYEYLAKEYIGHNPGITYKEFNATIAKLDETISQNTIDKDTDLYVDVKYAYELKVPYSQGTLILWKQYLSGSTNDKLIGKNQLHIRVPAGTPGYTNGKNVLLDRDYELRITQHEKIGETNYFKGELVRKLEHLKIHPDPIFVNYGAGELSDEEQKAKDDYEMSSRFLNTALRKQEKLSEEKAITKEHLDILIARSTTTEDVIAWRGIRDVSVIEELINAYKNGTLYVDKGFMSTSLDEEVTNDFSVDTVKIRIKIPKGTNSFYTNDGNLAELILGRETPLRITNHEIKENGLQYFEAEVVQEPQLQNVAEYPLTEDEIKYLAVYESSKEFVNKYHMGYDVDYDKEADAANKVISRLTATNTTSQDSEVHVGYNDDITFSKMIGTTLPKILDAYRNNKLFNNHTYLNGTLGKSQGTKVQLHLKVPAGTHAFYTGKELILRPRLQLYFSDYKEENGIHHFYGQVVARPTWAYNERMDDSQRVAHNEYTDDSDVINSYLREKPKDFENWIKTAGFEYVSPKATSAEVIKEWTKSLDKLINRSSISQEKDVYRGIDVEEIKQQLIAACDSGGTVIDKGFLSTSLDKNIAKKYGHKSLIHIKLPKDTKAFYTGYKGDQELTLGRNTEIRINSYTETNGDYLFEASLVVKPNPAYARYLENTELYDWYLENSPVDKANFDKAKFKASQKNVDEFINNLDIALNKTKFGKDTDFYVNVEDDALIQKLKDCIANNELLGWKPYIRGTLNKEPATKAQLLISATGKQNAYVDGNRVILERNRQLYDIKYERIGDIDYFTAKVSTHFVDDEIRPSPNWVNSGVGELSDDEAYFIGSYQVNSIDLNTALRQNKPFEEGDEYKKNYLDAVMNRTTTTKDAVVWRGVFKTSMAKVFLKAYEEGTIYVDKAFMSTTLYDDIADLFSAKVKIRINVPKGTHSYFTDSEHLAELILARNTGLRFTNYVKKDKFHYFEADAIQKENPVNKYLDAREIYNWYIKQSPMFGTKEFAEFASEFEKKRLTQEKVDSNINALDRLISENIIAEDTDLYDNDFSDDDPNDVKPISQLKYFLSGTTENKPKYKTQLHVKVPAGTPGYYDGKNIILGRNYELKITTNEGTDGITRYEGEIIRKLENPKPRIYRPSYVNHGLGKLSKKEIDAKSSYITSSAAVNISLRQNYELTGYAIEVKEHLDAMINRSTTTEDVITWRGIRAQLVADELINAYKNKTLCVDKGFMSTCLEKEGTKKFSKDILVQIKVPKGTHSLYTDEALESELILGRNTALRVILFEIRDGLQYFEAEVV
jgi:ribosomal protein L31